MNKATNITSETFIVVFFISGAFIALFFDLNALQTYFSILTPLIAVYVTQQISEHNREIFERNDIVNFNTRLEMKIRDELQLVNYSNGNSLSKYVNQVTEYINICADTELKRKHVKSKWIDTKRIHNTVIEPLKSKAHQQGTPLSSQIVGTLESALEQWYLRFMSNQ